MKHVMDEGLFKTPASVVVSAERSLGVPPEMLAAAGQRLAQVALIYAIVDLYGYVIAAAVMTADSMPMPPDFAEPYGLLTAIFVGISLAVAYLAGSRRIPAALIPDVGLIYMVVGALGIEIGLLWLPPSVSLENFGLSWTVVWLAIFPLIVPATPGKMFFAALAAASLRGLMLLILVAHGRPAPEPGLVIMLMFPNAIAVGLAVLGTRIIFELGRDVSRARQMGSYELIERLGGGGMGEVWRAQHGMLARPAAVKLIRPDSLGQAEPQARLQLLKRFEREAHATAALSSPHTVQIHDFGVTQDSTFYYVMELLNGLDTDDLVTRFGPVSPARAVHILSQVCESLAEAHARGLVHRDIKPANIFLCRLGLEHDFVKVLDFGLVKAAAGSDRAQTALTQQHVATGTPAFMAPEIAMGEGNVDGRTDLYAVGCLGYWLLTGRLVFEQGNAMQIMLAHASQPPKPLSTWTEQPIPPDLEALIMACLAKEPAQRPASAGELRRRIDAIATGETWDRDAATAWWQVHLPEYA